MRGLTSLITRRITGVSKAAFGIDFARDGFTLETCLSFGQMSLTTWRLGSEAADRQLSDAAKWR